MSFLPLKWSARWILSSFQQYDFQIGFHFLNTLFKFELNSLSPFLSSLKRICSNVLNLYTLLQAANHVTNKVNQVQFKYPGLYN